MSLRAPRTTLRDVAREAGVSVSIASRVINNDDTVTVREDTRERILQAARALRYRANAAARGVREGRAGALGMLIPSLTEPAYARIVRGAMARANELGVVVLLAEDPDSGPSKKVSLEMQARMIEESRVDGLIIASIRPGHPMLRAIEESSLPHVFVNRSLPGSRRNVTMRDDAASRLAVAHLTELGHTRIAHLSGPPRLDPSARRLQAFRSAMRELGVPRPVVAHARFTSSEAARGTRELLLADPDLTAIYTSNFTQGIGALAEIRASGRRVPEDVSVITYDDLPIADALEPPLTTIRMPMEELGGAGVDSLLAQMAGKPVGDVEIAADPELVVRQSTLRPSRRAPRSA
jgi:DNA-binding LacI/PurR family transcriptional regulator